MSTGIIPWLLTWAVIVALGTVPVGWLIAGLTGGVSGALTRFTDRSLREAFKTVVGGGAVLFGLGVVAASLVAGVGGGIIVAVGGLMSALVLGVFPVGVAYLALTRGIDTDDADGALASVLAAWPVALAVAPVTLFVTGDLPLWATVVTVGGTPPLSVVVHVARNRLRG